MEDEEIEFLMAGKSDQVKVASGGTEQQSQDLEWILGSEGDDFMSNDISVGAYNGRTNIVTDYALLMAGLEGNDTMDGAVGGSAGGRGSHAIVTDNLFRMHGGEGADWVRAGLPAGSSDGGVFTFRDNRVDVRGRMWR
jgi:hypothetical protein